MPTDPKEEAGGALGTPSSVAMTTEGRLDRPGARESLDLMRQIKQRVRKENDENIGCKNRASTIVFG